MTQEEKYNNYLNSFKNLDIDEKKEFIISDLNELINAFYKINTDFNKNSKMLPVEEDYETNDEFLDKIFTLIASLKEVSADTLSIILENFYKDDNNE